MVKVDLPLHSGDARGQFGKKIIFTKGGYARRYFRPRNPNTDAQKAVREAFKEFVVPPLTQAQADLLYAAINHLHDDRYSLLSHVHSHSNLEDLENDDHEQYFNEARGDARYPLLSHTHVQTVPYAVIVKPTGTNKASDVTLADDPHLTCPLAIGKYSGRFDLFWGGANTTHDGKLTLSLDSYTGVLNHKFGTINNFAGVAVGASPAALSVFETVLAFGSANVYFGMCINFVIDTTTARTLSFQWAQNTSNVNNLTLAAGSRLEIYKS